jgi:hypothetical protein
MVARIRIMASRLLEVILPYAVKKELINRLAAIVLISSLIAAVQDTGTGGSPDH